MNKREAIGNIILSIGVLMLFLFAVYYVKEYTSIPNILEGEQLISWSQMWFWLISVVLFIVGYLIYRWGKIKEDLKNLQQSVIRVVAEVVVIIYTALLILVFFQNNLKPLFKIALIITIIILVYVANQMRK